MNIKIVSNFINDDLFKISKSFYSELPYEKVGIQGINGLFAYPFIKYLITTNDYDFEWIIYLDEDCFITNLQELESLLRFQINNNYYCSGMPDGGIISHRFHNPVAINPFFMILNIKKIKEILNIEELEKSYYNKDLEKYTPYNLIKSENIQNNLKYKEIIPDGYKPHGIMYDNYEEFYKLFFYLLRNNIKILYLDAYDYPNDLFTTVLKNHNGQDFAYHTWFARNWIYDQNNRKRILDISNHCNQIKK